MGSGAGYLYLKAGGVVIAFVMVLLLSLLALIQRPPSTLVEHLLAPGSITCEVGDRGNEGWWHLRLEVDRKHLLKPWTLMEDQPPTYRLEWIPSAKNLRLIRCGPGPKVLGSVGLDEPPQRVVWRRHSDLHEIQVGERVVLRCLDLLSLSPGARWRLDTPGEFGRSELFIHDDRHLLESSSQLQSALKNRDYLRGQISLLLSSKTGVDRTVLKQSTDFAEKVSLDAAMVAQATSWVIWSSGVACIRNTDAFMFTDLDKALVQFSELANANRMPPQTAGILMNLVEELVHRVTAIPGKVTRTRDFIEQRRQALKLIEKFCVLLGAMARSGRQTLCEDDLRDILLLKHTAVCLSGGRSQDTTPVMEEPWLLSRWRAVIPTLPLEDRPLDIIPHAADRISYLRPSLNRLLEYARLDRLPEIVVHARILDALSTGTLSEKLSNFLHHALPERERHLTRLILLAGGHWRPDDPSALIVDAVGQPLTSITDDPLAYALARLAAKRLKLNLPALDPLPVALTAEERLLAGDDQSLTQVFGRPTTALPPEQLLTAALSMQEVVTGSADWSLLTGYPCLYLPLTLIVTRP